MSITGAAKMAPQPKLGLKAEACRTRDLLMETFEFYERLKKDYYPRILAFRGHLKLKEETDMFEEYLRLDYLNMAAAFDLTFEVLTDTLNCIGSDPWEPLTIPSVPLDSKLTFVKLPSQLAFSVGLNVPQLNPKVFERFQYNITSVEHLLVGRSLQRTPWGSLLDKRFTETKAFQSSQVKKILSDLSDKSGLFLAEFELEAILSEIEKGNKEPFNALLALAYVYRDLKEEAAKTRKILLRSMHLKILGEDFFTRHDIVLVERTYP
ncbi:MAG: hypothetical protein ACRCTP_04050 [Aeromonas popoffii]|uniref:hypothetical protein n=1 Tax=Aeromonas popoffii TaxID=70856 RepID=UPI003F33B380